MNLAVRIAGIRIFERSVALEIAHLSGLFVWPTGGADRTRTDDLRLARAALSQLSYSPRRCPGPSAA
jgi:hypothetical protein